MKNILKQKIKKVPFIITVKVDWMILDEDDTYQKLNDAINKKRRDTKTDDFQFPIVEITNYRIFDGLGFYSIEINKKDFGRKKYESVEDVVNSLYECIMTNKDDIKKLIKKYKIE